MHTAGFERKNCSVNTYEQVTDATPLASKKFKKHLLTGLSMAQYFPALLFHSPRAWSRSQDNVAHCAPVGNHGENKL